ncbi:hypothetical protein [Flavivirga spongiicola]|uniref:Cytochrome c domain-containing protein n=1 Tax=Flavivirga spongiicola TaxID=421621 RepID=A0ABU7XPL8_9FLAO|nr:hypothetical protein [Flavivirga sp. MEBiC05379]MDO5977712.1 hypothetical protein [Flavivirga sp. MEBiC05379]
MNLKNFIYLCTVVLVFNCSNGSDDTVSQPDPNAKITYNANVKSIIASNCLQCHGNPTANGAPFSLVTYTQVKSKIDDILPRINSASSPMPPTGQMLFKNIELIQKWKDDGLLEN